MGRTGARGGGRSSGGSHRSSGRTSSHRVGGGGRTGSRSFGGTFGNFGHSRHHMPHFGHYRHRTTYVFGPSNGGRPAVILVVAIFVIVMLTMFFLPFVAMNRVDADIPASTVQRKRLETGNAFMNSCVVDEISYIDNIKQVETDLMYFWEKTGVQPFVYLKDYDSNLQTDQQKEEWAEQYYEQNFDRDDVFLYVYFEERDTNSSTPGLMVVRYGAQASSVMDSQAEEIFWGYMDRYWLDSSYSTDEVFELTYQKTADSIMRVSTTKLDVLKYVAIGAVVLIVVISVVVVMNKKRRHERERAEETERILNADIKNENLQDEVAEDILGKYEGTKQQESGSAPVGKITYNEKSEP